KIKLEDTDADEAPPDSPAPSGNGDVDPVAAAAGRGGSRWVIDRTEKGSRAFEIRQFSSSGEFLRRLPVAPEDPQPKSIAASLVDDKIYLLDENGARQRVRGLSLAAVKKESTDKTVSEWKVDFEKSIVAHPEFSVTDGKVVPSGQGT